MVQKRQFEITGLAPAQGKAVNDFIRNLDLGTEGMFVEESHVLTATLSADATAAQIARQPAAIQQAYEQAGWMNVRVVELSA